MIGSFGRGLINSLRWVIGLAGYFAAGAARAKPELARNGLSTEPKMGHSNLLPWWDKQRPMSETQ